MLGGPTRALCILWGQKLSSYVPLCSPSGLVRGHVLRRYPVSGAVAASSAGHKSDAEVAAHVEAAEWLPARTPAEVVLNANEFSTLHAVPTVSPEDVRWCTRYLLATSSTFAARGATERAGLVDSHATNFTLSRDVQGMRTGSCETPSGGGSTEAASIAANLVLIRHVLTEHHQLLAGAESLQTGVPISCILAELEEAQMYLTWSLDSHRSGPSTEGVLSAPSWLYLDVNADNSGFSAVRRGPVAPLSVGLVRAAEEAGGTEFFAAPHQRLGPRERKERLELLRQRFEGEVTHLHSRGPRGTSAEAFQEMVIISGERAEGEAFLPIIEPRVPLLTVVTSTGNSLAAAVKAAAVAWARCASGVRSNSGAPLRCCVYAEDILWRPAPATALVATWWAALLRQHHRGSITTNAAENPHASAPDASAQPSMRSGPPIRAGVSSGRGEACLRASGRHSQESAAAASSVSARGLNFHMLITGGDTADHFLFPLMAGVDESVARTHAPNGRPSKRIDVAAQSGDHGGGDATSARSTEVACVSAAVLSWSCREPEAPVMLLCYGCPAAQVAHLHAIRHAYLARHDMANASMSVEPRVPLTRQSGDSALVHREGTTATSGQSHESLSMGRAEDATTGMVELCTESPAVSMIAASRPMPSASTPSSVWSSSALLLSYHRRGSGLPFPSADAPHVLSAVAGAARTVTLEEAAACIFESSVLERPLRHASLGDAGQGACLAASQQPVRERQTVTAPSALYGCASLKRGWCSLCLVPRTHAPALLSALVQRHFGQPLRTGHSLDALCRRGPAPSPSHVQMAQEVLRCATRGGCTHRRSPQGGNGRSEHTSAGSSPSPASVSIALTSSSACASGSTCASEGLLRYSALSDVGWRHVCGGFILPLTAIGGRDSPYLVPCMLFTDLAEVASTITTKGHERRRPQGGSDAAPSSGPASQASEARHDASPREALNLAHGAPPSSALRLSASDEAMQAQVEVACAVAAVERSVFQLRCAHDTEGLGYRGVVAGNYLFVCSYPDAWQHAVRHALMEK
ncbi:hypothetical protein LSCM1_01451 [Leishmania martiniquensis]|uniref:Uncharacterized protein n=1 Tax=Leishmania martiniquensis TaxID=1580590 RepID=A0A836KG12_9TRYP|nr:hypothetical protein LSCM1_01451 [Leishmania martiniquensis]